MAVQNKNDKGFAPFRWISRMFRGGSKELTSDGEKIVSPTRQMVNEFFRKKLAVGALIVFLLMFLLAFVGPLFWPIRDINYTSTLTQNVPPILSMLSVPKELNGKIRSISSFSTFTVGLSTDGKVYTWGSTKNSSTSIDISVIPKEVKEADIRFAAAGLDHVIAIDANGKIYGWGNKDLAQYGAAEPNTAAELLMPIPDELLRDGIGDVNQVKKLICAYQATALLMKDGRLYVWGNNNSITNLTDFVGADDIVDVAFTGSKLVAVKKDGTFSTGSANIYMNTQDGIPIGTFCAGTPIVAVSTTYNTSCFLLEDGRFFVCGKFEYNEKKIPELRSGEKPVQIASGMNHYVMLTDQGNCYCWGDDEFGQTLMPGSANGADQLFAGSMQSYAVKNGSVKAKWGLKGYLMGTDGYGRDVFRRIIGGGKMTMTIGAVAVIISSFIGVIIGCVSGYFGGRVDMILMRVEEIVAAIPFLPFALILSAALSRSTMSENQRIFLIMVILGILSWTGLARLVRAQVLAEREKEFVTAAQAMGVKEHKIVFRHILKNVISVILVSMTLDFAGCMLTEASLSYLGFGVQLPRPTWGNMLNGSNNAIVIGTYWWQWVFTALCLGVATICINIIGDALRDVFDPKSSSER